MGRRKRGQRMRGPMIFEDSCRKEWSGSGGFPGDAVSSGGVLTVTGGTRVKWRGGRTLFTFGTNSPTSTSFSAFKGRSEWDVPSAHASSNDGIAPPSNVAFRERGKVLWTVA